MSSDSKLLLNSNKYNVNDVIRNLNNCSLIKKVNELEGSSSIDFYTIDLVLANNEQITLHLHSSANSPLGKCLSVSVDKFDLSLQVLKYIAKNMGGFLMDDSEGQRVYEEWVDPVSGLEFYLNQAQTSGLFQDTTDPDVHASRFAQDLKKHIS